MRTATARKSPAIRPPRKPGDGGYNPTELGLRLTQERNERKLSREKLAYMANLAVATVARLELGSQPHPRTAVIGQLLRALRANPHEASRREQTFEREILAGFAGL